MNDSERVCPKCEGEMKPGKFRKIISISLFMYSFGMAFAVLYFGTFSIETDLIGIGLFALIIVWLWVILTPEETHSDEKQVQ